MNPEFVLVVGDMFVPCRQSDIPQKFNMFFLWVILVQMIIIIG